MSTFPASIQLSNLNGINGFTLEGVDSGDRSGFAVSEAGDFNGDGIDDIIVSSYTAAILKGRTQIIFGSNNNPATLDLATIAGSRGVDIQGANIGDISGFSVNSVGDVNGDNIDDIIIGARRADGGSEVGKSYVVYGSTSLPVAISLDSINNGNSAGFAISGVDLSDLSGTAVDTAGDFNGDGVNDLMISAMLADPNGNNEAGETYVVYGSTSSPGNIDLSNLNGTNGFVLNGIAIEDESGSAISSAGDFNGDGKSDILIGAPKAEPNGLFSGEAYVLFGNNTNTASSIDLSSLNGTNGFIIQGANTGDLLGSAVSSAGDINGDGIDDIIIGAPFADPGGKREAGKTYVVFGNATTTSLDLSDLNGSNGFVLNGIVGNFPFGSDKSGRAVSGVGDINSDGIDDIIIGAPEATGFAGEAYVLFGGSSFAASMELSNLDGTNGFTVKGVNGNDRAGRAVSGAGDVNGDGIADIIIGAYFGGDNNSQAGESYVVYGRNNTPSLGNNVLFGTTGNNIISGLAGNDTISGDDGDDLLLGDDGDDLLLGEAGNDGFYGGAGSDTINGGEGSDFLVGEAGADTLNGGNGSDVLVGGADADILNGDAGSDLLYGDDGDDTMAGGEGTDIFFGGNGNDTMRGGAENDSFQGGNGLDVIYGDDGNDRISGEGDSDMLYGGLGVDTIFGGEGFDSLFGNEGDDYLFGNEGNDTLQGDEGMDVLYGGAGNDLIKGGMNRDVLYGDGQNDTLEGGEDNDSLFGGTGDDILRGGVGDDELQGDAGLDTLYGDAGDDRLSGEGDDDMLWGGAGGDRLNGGAGNDALHGEAGDDGLNGGAGNDLLDGGAGDDYMMGNEGNDQMIGGLGNDFMMGGAGDDTLTGGLMGNNSLAQIDSVIGGAGSDTFVVKDMYAGFGDSDYVVIQDFDAAEDMIDIGSGNYSLENTGGSLLGGVGIFNNAELIAIVQGQTASSLSLTSSYFITT